MKKIIAGFICTIVAATVGFWAIKSTSEEDPFTIFFAALTQSDFDNLSSMSGAQNYHDYSEYSDIYWNIDWSQSPQTASILFDNHEGLTKFHISCAQAPLEAIITEANLDESATDPAKFSDWPSSLPSDVLNNAREYTPEIQGNIRNCHMIFNMEIDHDPLMENADDPYDLHPLHKLCEAAMIHVFGGADWVELASSRAEGTSTPPIVATGFKSYDPVSHENGILLGAYCHQRHNLYSAVEFSAWFLPKQP